MELGVGCHKIGLQDAPSAGFVFRSSHDGVRVLFYTVLRHLFNKPFNWVGHGWVPMTTEIAAVWPQVVSKLVKGQMRVYADATWGW